MILLVSNKKDETSDYLEKKIEKPFFRLNTDNLINRYIWNYHNRYFKIFDKETRKEIHSKNILGVVYRRPKNPIIPYEGIDNNLKNDLSIESRIMYDSVISSLETKWMSNPYKIRMAENKILQYEYAKKIGFNVPKYFIGNSYSELKKIINRDKVYCIKPLYLGPFSYLENTYVPYTSIIRSIDDLELIKNFPSLIQEYIDKKYEYRVTIIGKHFYCVKIDSQKNEKTKIDWRVENCMAVDYYETSLPNKVIEKCKKLLKSFEVSFSAIDLIEDKNGKYYFLDLNPNGQWAWLDEILNMNMVQAFEEYFYG